ncbi:hypothetical protein CAPTEDRAFT_188244 [Capitella teleta]|uniref:Major facilitator superfamily associated domain-containing protein n=1 Tax=Capitella teleta TaxID=283909 RepID=R7V287_CAPTE|nr:hypothetical protein CAPTEDRAFT_188244 [Capitella teleta]|eukprot:ELU12968.1 hypothetical protein CAPTEDRAFT_188244 [Capitella teleta]
MGILHQRHPINAARRVYLTCESMLYAQYNTLYFIILRSNADTVQIKFTGSLLGGAVVSQTREPETICGIELFFSDYRILAYVFIGFMVLSFFAAANIKFKEFEEFVIPILNCVTFSCIWVSLTAYTAVSVPSASLATVQGILHGVYFGLGNGTGHLIGGLLIGAFGAKVTFFGFSGASFLVLILFIVAQQCSTKPTFKSYGYTDLDRQVD